MLLRLNFVTGYNVGEAQGRAAPFSLILVKEGKRMMSDQNKPSNPFRQPLTDAEREQIKFLVSTLFRFLIAVVIAAGIMGIVVMLLD